MPAGSLVIEETVRIPSDVFDLEGFLRFVHSPDFPQRGRFSFLGGEVNVDMSPEELVTHNYVRVDVGADLARWVQNRELGRLFSVGALLVNTAADLATEPDLMFCSWDAFRRGDVRLAEWIEGSGQYVQLEGSPDLVLEVVSATSVVRDVQQLRLLYFAAGVQEYWLIDARDELDCQIFVRGSEEFVPVEPDDEGYLRSTILRGAFRAIREPDPTGGFQYRLLSKE